MRYFESPSPILRKFRVGFSCQRIHVMITLSYDQAFFLISLFYSGNSDGQGKRNLNFVKRPLQWISWGINKQAQGVAKQV